MEGMLTGLVLLMLFAAMVAALPFAYAGWRRLTAREGDLQIWRAMRRSGIAPQDASQSDAKMARAVRRCVLCPSIEECDHWLASGNREGLGLFCPNASFFGELKTAKDHTKH
jgi:hypothetical protein